MVKYAPAWGRAENRDQQLWLSPWLRPIPSTSKTIRLVFMDYFTFTVAELCSNEKYRDQSKLLEANGCFGKGQWGWKRRKTRFAWERRSRVGCKDSVQCIPESDGCTPYSQICAYPTAISFHTKWPSATVFIQCTLCHIHPSIAACSNKQTYI